MKIGPLEIGLILVIILIVFGVGKLPEVGKSLGKGIRDFKKYSGGAEDEEKKSSGTAAAATSPDMEVTKAKLEAAEAKLKLMEQSKKAS